MAPLWSRQTRLETREISRGGHCNASHSMVPALINVQIIFSYLWILYGDVHMQAIHHWD